MRADTWEKLNGTGWGQKNPSTADAVPLPLAREVDTVEIPMFMYETTQSVLVPASAYRAQGMGRVKRQERAEKKQRRDFRNGIVYTGLMFGLLVLANLLVEVMCG